MAVLENAMQAPMRYLLNIYTVASRKATNLPWLLFRNLGGVFFKDKSCSFLAAYL